MQLPTQPVSRTEFIVLNACLISMVAMCIDAVLPALGVIALDFQLAEPNQRQWVIAVMFVGMTLGQYFYGPLADRFGRRRTLFGGMLLFLVGSLMCFLRPVSSSYCGGACCRVLAWLAPVLSAPP